MVLRHTNHRLDRRGVVQRLHPEVFVAFRTQSCYSRVWVKNTVLIVGVVVVLSDMRCVQELQGARV
jgi:hypothetical protein